jgi:hypothetical protein
METVVIDPQPQIIAQGVKRKTPGDWRSTPNPLRDILNPWQIAAATLRYHEDHEYNVIVAGSILGSPVYVDSYTNSTFFFNKNCFLFIIELKSVYHIKHFKCVNHAKGEGAKLLYFAMKYLSGPKDVSKSPIVLEPDYSMAEHGQFQGAAEEQNRKLIAYYAKLGFIPMDEAKATQTYGLAKYHAERPPMENTIGSLIQKLQAGGNPKRRRKSRRKSTYSSQSRRSKR